MPERPSAPYQVELDNGSRIYDSGLVDKPMPAISFMSASNSCAARTLPDPASALSRQDHILVADWSARRASVMQYTER